MKTKPYASMRCRIASIASWASLVAGVIFAVDALVSPAAPVMKDSARSDLAVQVGDTPSLWDTSLSSGYALRNIEDLQVGDRVWANNPELTNADREIDEPDPEAWRTIDLAIVKKDGYRLDIRLLRPLEWLEIHETAVGDVVVLDIPEMQAYGLADVVAIGPCAPLDAGPGALVTGTYRHTSSDILDVSVSGLEDPIGTTVDHAIWSEDRQEFVPARQLRIGERLRTFGGVATEVTSIRRRGPPSAVYNLEVYGENVYYVSDLGVLVHNYNYGRYLKRHKGGPPAGMDSPHAHHVVVKGDFSNRSKIIQAYAEYSRNVLRKHGIDPIKGLENLHWAPNRGHSNAYIKAVAKELYRVDAGGGGRQQIVEALARIAGHLQDKGFPPP